MKFYITFAGTLLFFCLITCVKGQENVGKESEIFFLQGKIISNNYYYAANKIEGNMNPLTGSVIYTTYSSPMNFIEDSSKFKKHNETFIPLVALLEIDPFSTMYTNLNRNRLPIDYSYGLECDSEKKIPGFYAEVINDSLAYKINKIYSAPGYYFRNHSSSNEKYYQLNKYYELNSSLSENALSLKTSESIDKKLITDNFRTYLKNIKHDCYLADDKKTIWTSYLYDINDTTSNIQLLYDDDIEVQIDTVNKVLTAKLRDIYNFKKQKFKLEFKFHPGEVVTYFSLIDIEAPEGCYWVDNKYKGLVCE